MVICGVKNWICLFCALVLSLGSTAIADQKSDLIRRWNMEKGRDIKLKPENVLVRISKSELLPGLIAAGFKQSDGSYSLGRLVWKSQTFTPLKGFGAILNDQGFSELSDEERSRLFLELMKQTFGAMGTKPYVGKRSRRARRPEPLVGQRLPTNGHRFQIWFYDFPVNTEEGEWRQVLYSVSPDGKGVKARTLGSFHPLAERLRDFPSISPELFE